MNKEIVVKKEKGALGVLLQSGYSMSSSSEQEPHKVSPGQINRWLFPAEKWGLPGYYRQCLHYNSDTVTPDTVVPQSGRCTRTQQLLIETPNFKSNIYLHWSHRKEECSWYMLNWKQESVLVFLHPKMMQYSQISLWKIQGTLKILWVLWLPLMQSKFWLFKGLRPQKINAILYF